MKKIVSAAVALAFSTVLFAAAEPPAEAQYLPCYYCCFLNGSCPLAYTMPCGAACYCSGVVGVGQTC